MIAKYLLFFWWNVLVLTPQDFRYSFKTCPALGGGTLAPFLLIWYSLAFSDQFTVFQSFTSSISCSRFPSTVLGTCNLFCCLGAFFALLLASSMVSNILPFFAFSWLRKIFVEPGEGWHHYFFQEFSTFFLNFLFSLRIFFLPQQVKLSLSTQPWEPWTFLLQGTFPVAPYMQSRIPYLLLTLCFSLLFLLVWRFFFPGSSLAWLFTSVDASLLLATQPVLFLKRLLSTGVVKRQHLHSSTWCTVFLPWAVFSLLSIEYAFRYCSFFFWRRPLWNLAINGLIFQMNINIWATAHLPLP